MKVCVLQHVPFEGIGSMAAWLSGQDAANRLMGDLLAYVTRSAG